MKRWKGFGPRLAYIEVDDQIRVKFKKIDCKPVDEIFDVAANVEEKIAKVDKNKFVQTLSAMGKQKLMGENFEESLKEVLNNPPKELKKVVSKRVRNILTEKMEECS